MAAPCSKSWQYGSAPLVVFATALLLSHLPVLGGSSSQELLASGNCINSVPQFPPSLKIPQPVYLYYFQYGLFLEINQQGKVSGSEQSSNSSKMELESVGSCLILIKGIASGVYLAFRNVTSEVYTQKTPTLDAVFRYEARKGSYALESYQYNNWFLGLTRLGRPRKGKRVRVSPPNKKTKSVGLFGLFTRDSNGTFHSSTL